MSKIEWLARPGTTPVTWNPVTGCTPISAGCKNCYAKRMARRLAGRYGYPEAPNHFDVTLHHNRLDIPLKWRKPRTVFVCSMGDLFHKDVRTSTVASIVARIATTPQHTYIILTKRAERLRDLFMSYNFRHAVTDYTELTFGTSVSWPVPNMWLGVSIENSATSHRADYLRDINAAVKFISFEPLLGSMKGYPSVLDGIDWAIVGGESGNGARPMHPDWARDIRDQCQERNIPFFFKQWGAWGNHYHTYGMGFHSVSVCYACGSTSDCIDWEDTGCNCNAPIQQMRLVGKNRAGRRRLDRQEYNQWPKG